MYRPNPFTDQLDYRETARAELREFFSRFVDALPERTAILAEAVRSDDAFGAWAADLTPLSLEPLGAWFVAHVRTRPKTEAELAWTQARSLGGPVLPVTLTDTTYSLAADVGMYLARVMTGLFPQLKWHLPLGGKTLMVYGQPVLNGFRNSMLLPPVHIATVLAWKVAHGTQDPLELRQTLDVWATHVDPPPHSPLRE